VEIIRDRWGISHIYARNQPDLFFAQGFNVARDRLFQLEIWRRQATGTLAEILGHRALQRDIGARLLKARVDMGSDMRHYHPNGEEIITSFVRGINAYIDLTRREPDLLPLEFRLLDLIPGHWTPEVVVSRHNGLFRNASSEISLAKAVAALGAEKVRDLMDLHPGKPALILKPELDASLLSRDILELYSASRAPVRFTEEDIRDKSERAPSGPGAVSSPDSRPASLILDADEGSNNWVVGGRHTLTGAPYLASLRMDQARTWEEFRDACSFSRTPSENMVWADREGNIGWQAVGITPLRPGWDGLLPVPGDGSCEWDGYLPIRALPHVFYPPKGYFSTANQDNIPPGYPYAVGFQWAAPFRQARIQEVLGSGRKFTRTDMMQLQHDVVSLPARALVPLLRGLCGRDAAVQKALDALGAWDFRMAPDSTAAAVYQSWQRRLSAHIRVISLSGQDQESSPRPPLTKMIAWLVSPDGRFGEDPLKGRDALLLRALEEAVRDLSTRLGPDMEGWRYGQERFHHIRIRHLLSDTVRPELRARLDIGPRPRGGNGDTVNQTSSGFNQTSGASFRIIVDLSDWDLSLGTNSPGQSGDPGSPHYRDLFEIWSQGKYFPVFFTRRKIETVAEAITLLGPAAPGLPKKR
jgi:acyl-homoserine lactone acylase PvdQ